ncbi:MAG: hypothetical protein GYA56_11285, partial [Geobacteraceae bacterium]|nr:hypothetical protein [Geobacteraceae bacterium]
MASGLPYSPTTLNPIQASGSFCMEEAITALPETPARRSFSLSAFAPALTARIVSRFRRMISSLSAGKRFASPSARRPTPRIYESGAIQLRPSVSTSR